MSIKKYSKQYLAKLILCFHPSILTTFTSSCESMILDIFVLNLVTCHLVFTQTYNFYQAQTSQ